MGYLPTELSRETKVDKPTTTKRKVMKICLYQFSKGNFHEEGVGDCSVCVPDENNKKCKMYYPIDDWRIENWQKKKEPIRFQAILP